MFYVASDNQVLPIRANHINSSNIEEETAHLADLFPNSIYFTN